MNVERFEIPDLAMITPDRFADARGFFSETWSQERFTAIGIGGPFVQDNHSLSRDRGVVRGLHCQIEPSPQGKLVRCTRGAIWDVAVDARGNSPTFGQWVGVELSAENWRQFWVPVGFLHGYCTLTPDTEVVYKVSGPYDRQAERGVIWNDPTLAIPWPVGEAEAVLSEKDRLLPRWAETPPLF